MSLTVEEVKFKEVSQKENPEYQPAFGSLPLKRTLADVLLETISRERLLFPPTPIPLQPPLTLEQPTAK